MAELNQLGRFQLKRVLGRGAMGVVYEGLDPTLNRRVAVKTILKNAAIDDETAQMYSTQFAREAKAAGRLSHPHIVQVYDFAEQDDIAYIVMEYIEGRELRSYFEAREKFGLDEVVRIMGELLDALDFAHEAGVIHRDIKPANVMIDAQRRVKLADFGVARIQDSERSAAGTMVGTPAFMSPEQIQGLKIDRRTDIFSAGTLLYQLLTGEQPFTGAGAWTVAKKIMQDDPPRPSSVVKSVAPRFDEIVNKALAKNPAQRYASAREFAAALRATRAPAPVVTAAPTAAAAAPAAARPEAKASEAEVEFWRAIQNSTDAAEFEFYLEQFPEGTYAPLARHKIAKLKAPEDAARVAAEQAATEAARRAAEEAARAAAAAQEKARLAAEAKARLEAEQQAAQQAAQQAQREAAERARLAAEAKARQEAELKARREADAKARRDAEEAAQRQAAERVRQADVLQRLRDQEAARAQAGVDDDATIAIPVRSREPIPAAVPRSAPAAASRPAPSKSYAVPAAIAALVLAGGGLATYLFTDRAPLPASTPAPVPVASVAPAKAAATPAPAAPAVDVEKIRRETEERVRKEFADKAAAERAALEKSLAEKARAEKAAAEKIAQAKNAAEKAAAEKAAAIAAAERLAAEKAAQKAAVERASAEKAAVEKAAADRDAAEKLAAEKAMAEKAAAERVVSAKAEAQRQSAEKLAAAAGAEGQLEKFIQRHGAAKILKQQPPFTLGSMNYMEVVYVNDGSCARGQIKEVTGGNGLRNIPRKYRCIPLTD